MSNELLNLENNATIEEINNKFKQLDKLKKKVKAANKSADEANDKAIEVSNKNVGFFNKKEIIQDLQESQVLQAEALTKNADALNVMFEFQESLAKITNELFFLGCESIATNNYVIKQLESKVNGAAIDKMDQMAKNEFLNVIKQLRDRQDVMQKLEMLQNKVKDQKTLLEKQDISINDLTKEMELVRKEYNCFNERIDVAEKKFHLKEEVNAVLDSKEDFAERIYVLNEQNDRLIREIDELKNKNSIFLKNYKKLFVIFLLSFIGIISIIILIFALMIINKKI